MNACIVSLYSGIDRGYLQGLAALAQSIDKHAKHAPKRLLWESGSLRAYDVFTMQAVGWETVEVDPIRAQPCEFKAKRWDCTFTKLHAFNQTDFKKVLFLDADCLLCSNAVESLLRRSAKRLKACWVCRESADRFNSGVMLFEPSRKTYDDLRDFAENSSPRENGAVGGDQSLLNIKFAGQWDQIADTYNQRHWGCPKPGVAIAHLRPHPWRGRNTLVHQQPYIDLWNRSLTASLGSGRARELIGRILDRKIVGAEVGVLRGSTSRSLLQFCPNLTLHMVDAWGSVAYQDTSDKAGKIKDWGPIYRDAVKVREQYADRAHIHAMTSELASRQFKDRSLDFVFIDAQHDYKSVSRDISYWLPKVKPGGFISGHDYHPNWPGVQKAVRQRFKKFTTGKDATWFAGV